MSKTFRIFLLHFKEKSQNVENITNHVAKIHEYLLQYNIKIERNKNSISKKEHVIDVLFDVRNLPM